jgi:hypothetical protein
MFDFCSWPMQFLVFMYLVRFVFPGGNGQWGRSPPERGLNSYWLRGQPLGGEAGLQPGLWPGLSHQGSATPPPSARHVSGGEGGGVIVRVPGTYLFF